MRLDVQNLVNVQVSSTAQPGSKPGTVRDFFIKFKGKSGETQKIRLNRNLTGQAKREQSARNLLAKRGITDVTFTGDTLANPVQRLGANRRGVDARRPTGTFRPKFAGVPGGEKGATVLIKGQKTEIVRVRGAPLKPRTTETKIKQIRQETSPEILAVELASQQELSKTLGRGSTAFETLRARRLAETKKQIAGPISLEFNKQLGPATIKIGGSIEKFPKFVQSTRQGIDLLKEVQLSKKIDILPVSERKGFVGFFGKLGKEQLEPFKPGKVPGIAKAIPPLRIVNIFKQFSKQKPKTSTVIAGALALPVAAKVGGTAVGRIILSPPVLIGGSLAAEQAITRKTPGIKRVAVVTTEVLAFAGAFKLGGAAIRGFKQARFKAKTKIPQKKKAPFLLTSEKTPIRIPKPPKPPKFELQLTFKKGLKPKIQKPEKLPLKSDIQTRLTRERVIPGITQPKPTVLPKETQLNFRLAQRETEATILRGPRFLKPVKKDRLILGKKGRAQLNIFDRVGLLEPTVLIPGKVATIISPVIKSKIFEKSATGFTFGPTSRGDLRIIDTTFTNIKPISDIDISIDIIRDKKKERRIPPIITVPDLSTDISSPSKQSQKRKSSSIFVPDIKTSIDEKPIIIPDVVTDITTKIKKPEKTPGLKIPELDFSLQPMVPKKRLEGYNAFAREKGKSVRLNRKAITKNRAKNLLFDVLDNTTSASGRIRRTKKSARSASDVILSFNASKFRERPKNKYTEPSRFRIDTPGEVRGLSVAKFLANTRRRNF